MEAATRRTTVSLGDIALIASAVLIVIGSIGPWAKVTFFGTYSVSGMDGDGVLTLVVGIAAGTVAVVALSKERSEAWITPVLLIAFLASGAIGFYDWIQMERVVGQSVFANALIDVGWGLPLVAVASLLGFVISLVKRVHGAL